MKEKDIKRIIRKQLKSNHPNWRRIPRKRKKEIIKEVTDAAVADYQVLMAGQQVRQQIGT